MTESKKGSPEGLKVRNHRFGGELNKPFYDIPDTWPGDWDAQPAPELKKRVR